MNFNCQISWISIHVSVLWLQNGSYQKQSRSAIGLRDFRAQMDSLTSYHGSYQEANFQDISYLLDACLRAFEQLLVIKDVAPSTAGAPSAACTRFYGGAPFVIYAWSIINLSHTQGSSPFTRPPVCSNKGCSFKWFMAQKPCEYKGSRDPKVTMKWITKIDIVIFIHIL